MKPSVLIFILLASLSTSIMAQPTEQWFKSYNGSFSGADIVNDMEVDVHGNVYVCGSTDTFGASSDYIVLKYGNDGTLLWKYTYNGPANAEDIATALGIDDSGYVYVTGRSKGIGTQFDFATIKLRGSDGRFEWLRRHNTAGQNLDDGAVDLVVNGFNIFVGGYATNSINSVSNKDWFIVSYGQNGSTSWSTDFGSNFSDEPNGVHVGNNGAVYLYGSYNETTYYIAEFNPASGSYVRNFNTNNGRPYDIVQDGAGNLFLTGNWNGVFGGAGFIHTTRLGATLSQSWFETYNSQSIYSTNNVGNSIDRSNSGDIYVTGIVDVNGTPQSFDQVTLRYDQNGNPLDTVLESQVLNKEDRGIDIVVDRFSNPSIYVLGQSENSQSNIELKVFHYNKELVRQWVYTKSCTTGDYVPVKIHLDNFDNLTVAGYYTCNGTQEDIFVTRICTSLPTAEAGDNDTICDGDSIQLSGIGTGGFTWSPASSLSNPNSANPIASPTQTTTYYLTVSYGGCEDIDSVTITVLPKPSVSSSTDTAICQGESTVLDASGGVSYTWSPGSSLIDSLTKSPVASPSTSTTYTVTATDINGCSDTATSHITVYPLPVANVSSDTAICIGESIMLSASGGSSYTWQPIAGLSNPNIANPIASPSLTTDYTVTVTDQNGCEDQNQLEVIVHPLPQANAGNDISLCSGSSVLLNATGGISCNWVPSSGLNNPNSCSPTASPNFTTNYTVTVVDANGCEGQDEVLVNVNPLPTANAGPDVTICFGDDIQLTGTGGIGYDWNPSTGLNNPTISNPNADPDSTITYTLTVSDTNGCQNTDPVTVTVNPEDVDAGMDIEMCEGDTVQMHATGGAIYSWLPTSGINDPDTSSPLGFPMTTTTYTVTITDTGNCSRPDEITVTVHPLPVKPMISKSGSNLNSSATMGNQWYKDGTELPGDTAQAYLPTTPGSYHVVVTDTNGCSNTSDPFVYTDIQRPTDPYNIQLAPNPTPNLLTVSIGTKGRYTLTVIDPLGSVLKSEHINLQSTGNSSILDLSDYPKGVYFLEVRGDSWASAFCISKL